MKEKKTLISEKSARTYFLMTFCTAILLFFYMELSNRQAQVSDNSGARFTVQDDWYLVKPQKHRQNAKPKTIVRAVPEYPWNETDNDLLADIETARRALSEGVPTERILDDKKADKFLDNCLALVNNEVPLPFHALLKYMEGGDMKMKVVADRDAWQRQPAVLSKGGIVPYSRILSELDRNFGVKHVLMKDSKGKACLFLLGPQTRD